MGAIFALGLAGCTSSNIVELDSKRHNAQIKSDIENIYRHRNTADILNLELDDAITMALQNNLDARVTSVESLIAQDNVSLAEFQAMPNVTASGTYTRRSNDAASSSESVLTGTQSLEPSTSADQSRRLADIEAQWNIIDAVIAYMDGQIASDRATIAQERLKKIKQNIEIDTINAYWRAYASQQSKQNYLNLLKKGDVLQGNFEQALNERLLSLDTVAERQKSVLDQQQTITRLFEDQDLSKIELKSLMTVPIEQEIYLTSKPNQFGTKFKKYKSMPVDNMVEMALVNRPELREIYLDGNISVQNTERELIRTFPGLNIVYSKNYDSNSFLSDPTWINFSAALSQSITDFITLPTRYRAAKNQELLVEERRKALTAAIIAQVYIGKVRIELAENNYKHALKNENIARRRTFTEVNKNNLGAASEYTQYLAKATSVGATTEKYIAFAEMQRAYIDLYRTLGVYTDSKVGV